MKEKFIVSLLFFIFIVYYSNAQFTATYTVVDPSCYGYSDASIELVLTGAIEPVTISWYRQGELIAANQDTLPDIEADNYIVIISDSTGYTIADTVVVTNPYQITTIDTIGDASCYELGGTFNITPQGGIGFYQGIWNHYIWNPDSNEVILDVGWYSDTLYTNPDTLAFIDSFAAGLYVLYITDSMGLGCTVEIQYEIKRPSAPLTMNEYHYHNICKNGNAGWINVVANGGTPDYTYAWSAGQTSASIASLGADTYTITISDANGCRIIESIDIEEPFQDLIAHVEIKNISCRDNKDGYIEIKEVENGIAPYDYQWSGDTSGTVLVDLDPGNYNYTITDQNDCQISDSITLTISDTDCITINNVITPDGNGKNDTWIIENIDLYPECNVSIFDRWGNQVFISSGYDNTWGATANGVLLNNGEYYYIVNLNAGSYLPYTGPLKIMK